MIFLESVKGSTYRNRLYSHDIRKKLQSFNIEDCVPENKKRLLISIGCPLAGCRRKFLNTNLLKDEEIQNDLRSVGDLSIPVRTEGERGTVNFFININIFIFLKDFKKNHSN